MLRSCGSSASARSISSSAESTLLARLCGSESRLTTKRLRRSFVRPKVITAVATVMAALTTVIAGPTRRPGAASPLDSLFWSPIDLARCHQERGEVIDMRPRSMLWSFPSARSPRFGKPGNARHIRRRPLCPPGATFFETARCVSPRRLAIPFFLGFNPFVRASLAAVAVAFRIVGATLLSASRTAAPFESSVLACCPDMASSFPPDARAGGSSRLTLSPRRRPDALSAMNQSPPGKITSLLAT
jgi:hypothetical protein